MKNSDFPKRVSNKILRMKLFGRRTKFTIMGKKIEFGLLLWRMKITVKFGRSEKCSNCSVQYEFKNKLTKHSKNWVTVEFGPMYPDFCCLSGTKFADLHLRNISISIASKHIVTHKHTEKKSFVNIDNNYIIASHCN